MNKTLISLAVLAASTGALAQSSVTLYGTADAGVGKVKRDSGKVGFQANSFVNTSDSFLGLRGTEDLGGGLKAGFQFEQSVNLRNGGTDTDADSYQDVKTMYQRAANLWLGGNWGTLRLGRARTPSFNALAAWELTAGARNSIVLATFGAAGEGDRNSSQISYRTPDFGGFAAELGYVFKADHGGNAKVDLGLTYINGPLRVGASYNKTKNLKANYAVGAQYQFGMFTLAAGYHRLANGFYTDDVTGQPIQGSVASGNGFSLGGKVNFGAASVLVNATRDTKVNYSVNGVGYNGKKYTNGLVEGRYAFSKRTFVYANYLRHQGGNNYGVGVRHDF